MMQPSRDVLLKTKTKNTFFFQEILILFSLKTVKYCNYFCKARHGSVAQVCKVFLFLFYSFRHVLTGFIIIQLLCECNIFYLIEFLSFQKYTEIWNLTAILLHLLNIYYCLWLFSIWNFWRFQSLEKAKKELAPRRRASFP